jgi:hypothetical protein
MEVPDNPKVPPASERLVCLAIPPECSTMKEAHERAQIRWPDEYMHRLHGLLAAGKLVARLVDKGADIKIVDTEFWSGNMYSSDLDFHFGTIRNYGSIKGKARIVFLTVDLDEKMPARTGPENKRTNEEAVPDTMLRKTRRGRPPKAGADDFWIEAARLTFNAEQGAANQTQENFIAAMIAWSQSNGNLYADDTIQDKIKLLWQTLKLGKK